jgi:hypothetical protein
MTKAELAENQWTLADKRKRERVAVELKFSTRLVANTRLTAGVTLLVARGALGCKNRERESLSFLILERQRILSSFLQWGKMKYTCYM